MGIFIWKFCLFDKKVVQNLLELELESSNQKTTQQSTRSLISGDIDKQRG